MSASALDGPNTSLPYATISPTHVIFDQSLPTTPTSEGGSAPGGSPPAPMSARLHRSSSSTLRSPDVPSIRLPTPDPSLRPLSPGVLNDASIIASYEVAHASDSSRSILDVESVSDTPFSSPPQSPFSALGAPRLHHQGIIFESPASEMDFLSDSDADSFIIDSPSNASADESANGDDSDTQSNHWEGGSTSSWASATHRSG